MSVAIQADHQRFDASNLEKEAVSLLSQQIWCWGQDVLRPAGNWLMELGFQRIEAPADRESCSSVYLLELPQRRRVVLRGFGVFYGDDSLGGVFLPRFEFGPRYSPQATLECPPWSAGDLPKLSAPNDAQRNACTSLTLDLIDWIRSYEVSIVKRLGIDYRQSTLLSWNSRKRSATPADEMASSWRLLGAAVAENFQTLIPQSQASRRTDDD